MPPQLEKNHVVPTSWQDEAIARDGVSREVPCSALKGECLHPQGCLRRGVRASGPSQERTGESGAFGLCNNTREDSTHGHHQMVNTEIRLIIFFAAKDGEALYSQHGSPVPSTPERREGLQACYWEGPSELPERRSSSSAHRRGSAEPRPRGCSGLGEPRPALPSF